MEQLTFRLLVLHPNKIAAAELAEKVTSVVPFISFKAVTTEKDALDCHVETPYDMCLVANNFNDEKIIDLMKDLERLYAQKYTRRCVFFKVVESSPNQDLVSKVISMGFRGVISDKVEQRDKEVLGVFAEDMKHMVEVLERTADLGSTLQRVLSEVDRVARDRKRGRDTQFNKISINYLSEMLELDPSVFERYLDSICNLTENIPAPKAIRVKIPPEVLKQRLPKLAEKGYSGVSSRVWKKLIAKYGVGSDEPDSSATDAVPPETQTEEKEAPQKDIFDDDGDDNE